jgi:hypothetical protein
MDPWSCSPVHDWSSETLLLLTSCDTLLVSQDAEDVRQGSRDGVVGSEVVCQQVVQQCDGHRWWMKAELGGESEEGTRNKNVVGGLRSTACFPVPPLPLHASSYHAMEPTASTSKTVQAEQQPSTTFAALGVKPFLATALEVMSIRQPTGVQAACIPAILGGERISEAVGETLVAEVGADDLSRNPGADCIGSAQTGSGKTVAFAIPILQALSEDPYGFFALVLTPTRYVSSSSLPDSRLIPDLPVNSRSRSASSSESSVQCSTSTRRSSSEEWT